jgi:hypothetical protein
MTADERATTVFTAVILCAVVFFPISGYVGAMGAFDFYGDGHAS